MKKLLINIIFIAQFTVLVRNIKCIQILYNPKKDMINIYFYTKKH